MSSSPNAAAAVHCHLHARRSVYRRLVFRSDYVAALGFCTGCRPTGAAVPPAERAVLCLTSASAKSASGGQSKQQRSAGSVAPSHHTRSSHTHISGAVMSNASSSRQQASTALTAATSTEVPSRATDAPVLSSSGAAGSNASWSPDTTSRPGQPPQSQGSDPGADSSDRRTPRAPGSGGYRSASLLLICVSAACA